MIRARSSWAAVVFLHLIYLIVLHSRGAHAVAVGGLIAAGLLALAGSIRFRRRWAEPAVVVAFLLPALSLIRQPRIAVAVLDGRLWLIIAWLVACAAITPETGDDQRWRRGLPVALMFAWSSLFWVAIVSDVGVGPYMLTTDRTEDKECQSDPLAVAFTIWETHPPSEHLFLGWRTHQSLVEHHPYANHVHPYLLTMYTWSRIVRGAAGVPLYVATNTVPLLYMAVVLASMLTLLWRARLIQPAASMMRLASLFTGCGLLVTTWRFWSDLLRYSSDNPYPLLAGVLIFIFAGLVEPVNRSMVLLGVATMVALSPIHTPMLIVALVCLFWPATRRNVSHAADARLLVHAVIVALVTGAVVYAAPWMLIKWKSYTPQGSSFLFRSGLDGDTRYFTNMLQAVIAPCPTGCCWSRPVRDLLFPAFVPLVAFGALRGRRMWHSTISLTRLLFFLLAPYLFSLILFPQSISIHPYMYDHMVIVPVTVVGIVMMFEWLGDAGADAGCRVLVLILLAGGVIMSNMIGVAQALSRMPR